jgi:cell division protein FtsB
MTEDRLRRTDLAVMAYQQVVTTAGMDARRSRVAARWAWGAVAALVAVSAGVGIWSTQRVTRANADVVYLEEQVGDLQEQVTQRTEQVEQFRSEALEARIEAATVRGEITAMRQTQTTSHAGTENADIGRAEQASQRVDAARPADYSRPTTRPSTLVDRLSTLLAD